MLQLKCQHTIRAAAKWFAQTEPQNHCQMFEVLAAVELAGPGGRLVVAVQRDEFVAKYKPDARLVYDWNTRVKMLQAIRYVDAVVPYTDVDVSIPSLDFTLFATGPDQNHAGFERAKAWCRANGRRCVEMPRTGGVSSSDFRHRTLA